MRVYVKEMEREESIRAEEGRRGEDTWQKRKGEERMNSRGGIESRVSICIERETEIVQSGEKGK